MVKSFSQISQVAANDFIKSVILADDEVLKSSFDAKKLISSFAKEKKNCSIIKFDSDSDFEQIIQMDQNADVTILDWKIHEEKENKINDSEAEDDVEEEEIRGRFTKPVISDIVKKALELQRLKLVIIYTTEDGLSSIIDSIDKYLKEKEQLFERIDDFSLQKNMIRISVLGKMNLKNKSIKSISERAFNYDELPQAVSKEFSHLTNGIISNTVLKSITTLRDKTFNILNQFNFNLDPAFLSHRAMLANPDDADNLLISSIVDSFNSILKYSNVTENCSLSVINSWIDTNNFTNNSVRINNSVAKEISIGKDELKKWQEFGYKEFFKMELKHQKGVELNDNQFENFDLTQLHKESTNLFMPRDLSSDGIHEDFAILTHHSSNFNTNSNHRPILTLGSVVKRNSIYYLCIQQPCDSVRITNEERRFRFLPLEECEKKFLIIYKNYKNEYVKLKLRNSNSFDLITFRFKPNHKGTVNAKKEMNRFYFKDDRNEKYRWILDLKISHAQKILNDFAAKVSRVGIDESEWLRRS